MGFDDRVDQSSTLIEVLDRLVWGCESVASRIRLIEFGSEYVVPRDVHSLIRFMSTPTIWHIRYAPDRALIDRNDPLRTSLVEYKCTQTPLYSAKRLELLKAESGIGDLAFGDVGQWEDAAYRTYVSLADLGVRVAVLNYVAYHPRRLLCDYVGTVSVLHRDSVTGQAPTGSRTPYVNIDLRTMRSLAEFLSAEHGFDGAVVGRICGLAEDELVAALPELNPRPWSARP